MGLDGITIEENRILKEKTRTGKEYGTLATTFRNLKINEKLAVVVFPEETFHKVKVVFDAKKVDENYEKAEKAWLSEMKEIASHINLKKAIMKTVQMNKYVKLKEKIHLRLLSLISTSLTLKPMLDRKFLLKNVFRTVCKNSSAFELFSTINELQRSVLDVFYTTNIENPIDFHYLVNQLSNLTKISVEYADYIKKMTQQAEISHDSFEMFVKEKKRLDEFRESFNLWKEHNMRSVDDIDSKLRKKRKMLGVKWEEREIISKMQVITKKRAGLKRQRALQDKKDRIKFKL